MIKSWCITGFAAPVTACIFTVGSLAAADKALRVPPALLSSVSNQHCLVWGYIDRREIVHLTQEAPGRYRHDTSTFLMKGLLGGGGQITLSLKPEGPAQPSTAVVKAGSGSPEPFFIVGPVGSLQLRVDLKWPDLRYWAQAPTPVECRGAKTAIYIGDLKMASLTDGTAFLFNQASSSDARLKQFRDGNPTFPGEIQEAHPTETIVFPKKAK